MLSSTASPVTRLSTLVYCHTRDAYSNLVNLRYDSQMDPNLLAHMHGSQWDRLSVLAGKKLTTQQATEFRELYRRASKDLSRVQSVAPESDVAVRLSNVIHRSRMQLTGVPRGAKATVIDFFGTSLPAALYSIRWYFVGVFIGFVGLSILTTVWLANDTQTLFNMVPYEDAKRLAEHDFVNYYKENPNSVFAVGVWTNNAWIALQWVVLGITGIYVIIGLIMNAVNVGISGAVMFHFDRVGDFFGYILPHGVPEITCILIAAAAGLKIFTSWMIPVNMSRMQSLAHAARSLITVGVGLIFMLFLSGLIEGFVTPSNMPFPVKMFFGALLTVGICAYAIGLGRPAVKQGLTGDLEESRAGYRVVTAA